MVSREEMERLMQTVGRERFVVLVAVCSSIAVLVLILGWALVGLWAGLIGAVVVLGFAYFTLRSMVRATAGGPSGSLVVGTSGIDLNRLQGRQRQYVERALERRAAITRAVEGAGDPGVRRALIDSTHDLPELVASIYQLALKSQNVETALKSSGTLPQLIADTQRLDAQIKSTQDDFQRSQYQATLDSKLQQMQNLTDTEVALKRWDAQMENALTTLDTILSQVVRVSSSQVLSYTDSTDDLSATLRREVEELKATSDAFDNVYGAGR